MSSIDVQHNKTSTFFHCQTADILFFNFYSKIDLSYIIPIDFTKPKQFCTALALVAAIRLAKQKLKWLQHAQTLILKLAGYTSLGYNKNT